MEEQFLQKEYLTNKDGWLYDKLTSFLRFNNNSKQQIQNSDLQQFIAYESSCEKFYQEFAKSEPKDLQIILKSVFLKRIPWILFYNTIKNAGMMITIYLLDLVTNEFKESDPNLSLIGLFLSIMTISEISKSYAESKVNRETNFLLARIRIIVHQLIYKKLLRKKSLTNTNKQSTNDEDEEEEEINPNTLITTDIDELMYIQYVIIDVQTVIIQICASLLLLSMKDKNATATIGIALICALLINGLIAFSFLKIEYQLMKQKDKRVQLSQNVLGCMKQLKLLVWEKIFSKKILEIRQKEYKKLVLMKTFGGVSDSFWLNISYVLLYIFIHTSLNNGKTIYELNIFTLVAIFTTLKFPLGILPWVVHCYICYRVSINRIKNYLNDQDISSDNYTKLNFKTYNNEITNTQAILIQNKEFQWPQEMKKDSNSTSKTQVNISDGTDDNMFKLKIDQFIINRNTLNFVIGKLGSGKTALFHAILNELSEFQDLNKITLSSSQISGERLLTVDDQIIINGSIAYCAQNTWVQNISIRQNILCGKPFDEKLYNEVICVAQIEKDINTFDKKDLYEVGPDGKNISGGQKQRITLARALYQDCDIYLFDDIFSSLDIHVADVIFKKAIIEFLLNRNKTVLFITSHYRYLSQVPQSVQKKIILVEDGKISVAQDQIQSFLQSQQKSDHDFEEHENDVIEDLEILEINKIKHQQCLDQQEKEEQEQEYRNQNSIQSKVWMFYFQSISFTLLIISVILALFMQWILVLLDFWIKQEVSNSHNWLHNITIYFNNDFLKTFQVLVIVSVTITFLRSGVCVYYGLKGAKIIFEKLHNTLMNSCCSFYDTTNIGRIINRIQGDTHQVDDELPHFFKDFIECLTKTLILCVGLIILFPLFIVVFFGVVLLYLYLSKYYVKTNREMKRLLSANKGNVIQWLNETCTGITTVRALDKQEFFLQSYLDVLNKEMTAYQCGTRANFWFNVRLNLLSNTIFLFTCLFIFGSELFKLNVDYNTYALSLTYCIIVLESCFDLFYQYLELQQIIISVERIQQYLENKTEDIDIQINKQEKTLGQMDQNIAIEFKNIQLSYGSDENKLALKNFNLSIKKGEKIAFVGRTGSGKTSILNVLFGLYPFQHGSIKLYGQDIDELSLKQLRQSMSVVPQFGFLYNATVKDNLDPENKVPQDQIENLFRQSGFKLRGISASDNQCNTEFIIQQNGTNLSNGEKQVMNFLRTVLQDKSIICLDEATSNMDPETDQLLHQQLFQFSQNRTLLVITHRLENIAIYDRIVVMEQGEIVECGSYADLKQKVGGFFNKLLVHHQ